MENSIDAPILFVLGTRPEVIKLAPVIHAVEESGIARPVVCTTGQHREMLTQALRAFEIESDRNLSLMSDNQGLASLNARALTGLDTVYEQVKPAIVVVQGDTTTAMAGALAAYYRRIPIALVDGGLRTGNRFAPFPEETNRRVIGAVADLHFAPTAIARENLLREGVSDESIHVTGNTAIDALLSVLRKGEDKPLHVDTLAGSVIGDSDLENKRLVLVTAHRRENHAGGLDTICEALRHIAELPGAVVLFAVHLNPNVRRSVLSLLDGVPNVFLTDPLDYVTFTRLMSRAFVILTDSGGIQEEAPALGKPVVVLRETTERPEGIDTGNAMLAGASAEGILAATRRLWLDDGFYNAMSKVAHPYGDGQASARIVRVLSSSLGLASIG